MGFVLQILYGLISNRRTNHGISTLRVSALSPFSLILARACLARSHADCFSNDVEAVESPNIQEAKASFAMASCFRRSRICACASLSAMPKLCASCVGSVFMAVLSRPRLVVHAKIASYSSPVRSRCQPSSCSQNLTTDSVTLSVNSSRSTTS